MSSIIRDTWSARLDRMGIGASTACAIHCAGTAAILVLWPATWFRWAWSGTLGWLYWVELGFGVASLFFAFAAGLTGWLCHRRHLPPILLATGAVGICGGLFTRVHIETPMAGAAVVLASGAMLVAGHVLNLRGRRRGGAIAPASRTPDPLGR